MKTHIFLMQVHKDPQLLNRILKSLRKENHYFIINVDAKSLCAVDMLNVINAEKNIAIPMEKIYSTIITAGKYSNAYPFTPIPEKNNAPKTTTKPRSIFTNALVT